MLADHIGVPQLRDLASRSEQIVDKVSVRDMSRVADLLHSAQTGDLDKSAGELQVEIGFLGGMQGFPEIRFKVAGQLGICCQRCLGLLVSPIDLDFHLVVVESESDLEDVAEPFDAVVAGEQGVQLAALIEDEMLACLPLAPMHNDIGKCESEMSVLSVDVTANEGDISADTNKPFSDLATLLATSKKSNPDDKTN